MLKSRTLSRIGLVIFVLILSGCSGLQPFPTASRAGDTIALATGWKHEFSRDKITVTFTPTTGTPIVYSPNDPKVRASINLYADPASYMAVGWETGRIGAEYNYGSTYASVTSSNFTGGDPDWWQTTVLMDLPVDLPVGLTNITIESNGALNEKYGPYAVDILPGTGSANPFLAESLGALTEPQVHTLERAPMSEVSFSSVTIPYAIQLIMTHDPSNYAHVVNPRGDIKSVSWKDDGQNLNLFIMPTKDVAVSKMVRFKVYVSGGVKNLTVAELKAYDINGNLVPDVTATIK